MNENNLFEKISGLYKLDSSKSIETLQFLVENYNINPSFLCFAENILAEQFIESQDGVISKLNLESGETEFVCNSIDELKRVMESIEDSNYFLANSLRDDWEIKNKIILRNEVKLLPIVPFIAGGAFDSSNLYPVDRNKAISFLIDFYKSTKNLSDGSHFEFKVTP